VTLDIGTYKWYVTHGLVVMHVSMFFMKFSSIVSMLWFGHI